jgi:RNA polymerase sigma factor (sigma-70 family)
MVSNEKSDELSLLVKAARQGDRGSLNRLLSRLWPWLRRKAGFLVSRTAPIGVSSLTQETALRFSRSIVKTQAADSPAVKALLNRIMRNTAVSAHRAASRGKRNASGLATEVLFPSEYAPPDQDLERSEQKQRLLQAISQLPDRQRTAMLRLFEGVPVEGIATELGCSTSAVQMLIQRAKLLLQSVIGDKDQALLDQGS